MRETSDASGPLNQTTEKNFKEPNSDGLQPKFDSLQSDGLQPNSNVIPVAFLDLCRTRADSLQHWPCGWWTPLGGNRAGAARGW